MNNPIKQVRTVDFEQEVLKNSLPVVVDFGAPWCGPCNLASPVFEEVARKFAGKATFAKVSFDDEKDLVKQYGVTGIPTFLFFKGGKVVYKSEGYGAPSRQIWETELQKLV